MTKASKGFTLIELMIVVAITAILAVIVISALNDRPERMCPSNDERLEDLRWCSGTPSCQPTMTQEDMLEQRRLEKFMGEHCQS